MKRFITNSKIFYHSREFTAYKMAEPFSPISIELHISNRCNNACFYCGMDGVKDTKIMDRDEIRRAVKFIKGIGAKSIYLSGGGEPTVNPDYIHALIYAKAMNLDVGLITNGVSLQTDIVMYNCKWVRVSIDAADPQTYKNIRGVDRYADVSYTIKRLIIDRSITKSDCTIGLQVIPNKYNYTKIYRIAKSLLKQFPGVDYIQIRPIETRPIEASPYSRFELRVINAQLKALAGIDKILISDKWSMIGRNARHGFNVCHAAYFAGTVDAYGRYYLCCHMINDPQYMFCNIFEMSEGEFIDCLRNGIQKLGPLQGLNRALCPIGCRGSVINTSIDRVWNDPHCNFI